MTFFMSYLVCSNCTFLTERAFHQNTPFFIYFFINCLTTINKWITEMHYFSWEGLNETDIKMYLLIANQDRFCKRTSNKGSLGYV